VASASAGASGVFAACSATRALSVVVGSATPVSLTCASRLVGREQIGPAQRRIGGKLGQQRG
jgi:hypothetical protein